MTANTMRKILLALCLLPLAAASLAQPTPFPPPEPVAITGPYIVGSFGRSEAKKGCLGVISGGGRTCDPTDLAFGFGLGYQATRHFGVEANYLNLGQVKARGVTSTEEIHTTLWDLTGTGAVPFGESYAAYAKFGLYRATLDTTVRNIRDATKIDLTYGGGLQWNLDRKLGVRVQWQRFKKVGGTSYGINNYDVLSGGVLWRF